MILRLLKFARRFWDVLFPVFFILYHLITPVWMIMVGVNEKISQNTDDFSAKFYNQGFALFLLWSLGLAYIILAMMEVFLDLSGGVHLPYEGWLEPMFAAAGPFLFVWAFHLVLNASDRWYMRCEYRLDQWFD